MAGMGVCRDGDVNLMKGITFKGDRTVLTNGRPTASRGATFVMAHPGTPKHPHPPNPYLMNCAKTVLVAGNPMGHQMSIDFCMHTMMTKSDDVLVDM